MTSYCLRVDPSPITDVLLRGRKLDIEREKYHIRMWRGEEKQLKVEAEIGVIHLQAKECQAFLPISEAVRGEVGSCLRAFDRPHLWGLLLFRLLAFRTVGEQVSAVWSLSVCGLWWCSPISVTFLREDEDLKTCWSSPWVCYADGRFLGQEIHTRRAKQPSWSVTARMIARVAFLWTDPQDSRGRLAMKTAESIVNCHEHIYIPVCLYFHCIL